MVGRWIAGVATTLVLAWPAKAELQHEQCIACHIEAPEPKALKEPIATLCVGCHKATDRPRADHPVNFAPLLGYRGDLPLVGGVMTCATCHDPHGKPPLFLRRPADRLCQDCHDR
ncbi:MAG: cytochrome c3 family protein [Rhodospirillales bacterium]|nr:cytochrome c3 family protein [Rhodospirillales bacterium]